MLKLLAAEQARGEEREARLGEQQARIATQEEQIDAQRRRLGELEQAVLTLARRLDEAQAQPAAPVIGPQAKTYDERLRRIEEAAARVPELPPNVVSAGDFPGSIRVPGTDAAIKLGARIRTAAVFTLDPLGSTDRFLTNSIPVGDSSSPGEGRRTSLSANTSRFNFEVRTPTGAGQVRAFLEGDFFGAAAGEERTGFRLRHAYAQFHGFVAGQTWSTFSDPKADHQDLDFEGINGENVIRQAQVRYTYSLRENLSLAAAAETPRVSLTGGEGVNLVPDFVFRGVWDFRGVGHLQTATVLRQIRGVSEATPDETRSAMAWGASVSGVVPFRYLEFTDRLLFQVNGGAGNARYINDLNSLGGQDAVLDPVTGELRVLPALGWYVAYEHNWKHWKAFSERRLRTSLIWSYVGVDNFDFQPDDAYHRTNRFSANLVFSPIPRIDLGVEYIFGRRDNKDGQHGEASQVQTVGIFRF